MGYVALFASKVSDARGRGLILALDAIHKDIWDAIGSGGPVWGDPTEITIVGGVATVESGIFHYLIDTEDDDPTDNLFRISGLSEGQEVIIRPASGSRDVVVKDGTYLKIGPDFTMNNIYDSMRLLCVDGSDTCIQLMRSSPGS